MQLDYWSRHIFFLQPPCCSPDEGYCDLGGVCKDCTTVMYLYVAERISSYVFSKLFYYECIFQWPNIKPALLIKCQKKKLSWDLTFWNGSSASVTQIWIVAGHLQNNSGRSFHGSLMHCPLLIVQRVAMELILAVLIWMVRCIVIFNYVNWTTMLWYISL